MLVAYDSRGIAVRTIMAGKGGSKQAWQLERLLLQWQTGSRKSELGVVCGFWNLQAHPWWHTSSSKIPASKVFPKQNHQRDIKWSEAYGKHPHQHIWLHHNTILNSREGKRPHEGCSLALPVGEALAILWVSSLTLCQLLLLWARGTRAWIQLSSFWKRKWTSTNLPAPQVSLLNVSVQCCTYQKWDVGVSYWTGLNRVVAFWSVKLNGVTRLPLKNEPTECQVLIMSHEPRPSLKKQASDQL